MRHGARRKAGRMAGKGRGTGEETEVPSAPPREPTHRTRGRKTMPKQIEAQMAGGGAGASGEDEAATRLVNPGRLDERQVEGALERLLNGRRGREVLAQHQTDTGACDIFLPGRRTVVEAKKRPANGRGVDPDGPGRKRGETQYEQVQRYIASLTKTEIRNHGNVIEDTEMPWIGALTDGLHWYAWEFDPRQPGVVLGPHKPLNGRSFKNQPTELRELLNALSDRRVGKIWVPQDPSQLFQGYADAVADLWKTTKGQAKVTQHRLWNDLMRGSGMIVPESRMHSLYHLHCFLVTLARSVTQSISGNAKRRPGPGEGFASWIHDAPDGQAWCESLYEEVDRYNWRARENDVLRNVYMGMVDRDDRKLYGEYYTPDWLAQMLVEEALDTKWMARAVAAAYTSEGAPGGHGVLDPACGSGTFLYYAARRLTEWIWDREEYEGVEPEEKAGIITKLIWGIDIHPIAVEMSRATLLRALPAAPQLSPNVYQGDGLLMSDHMGSLFDHRDSEFVEPEGGRGEKRRRFHIPEELVDETDFAERIDALVEDAIRGRPLRGRVTKGLCKKTAKKLAEAHETLKEITKERGNGVWGWYIKNAMAPRGVAKRKVNRIVSNPPWLRWNELQEKGRSGRIRAAAENLGIWPGKNYGTGFDLGAVFAARTPDAFLSSPDQNPALFVLNSGALGSKNWQQYRAVYAKRIRGELDLSEKHVDGRTLRRPPFRGADSCVIGMKHEGRKRLVSKHGKTGRKEQVQERDRWTVARGKTQRIDPICEPTWAPSPYADAARAGATIFPGVLVRVDPGKPWQTMQPRKAKKPWSRLKRQCLADIPDHWRTRYVESDDLGRDRLRPVLSEAIIPNDGAGMLLGEDDARAASKSWRTLSDLWNQHRGLHSPEELTKRLNLGGGMATQWPPVLSVIYNASGWKLRAAVSTAIVEHKCYRVPVDSEDEGHYLSGVMNAECLADTFTLARESGRDFDKTPLARIPIPKYNEDDDTHARIAGLTKQIGEATVETDIRAWEEERSALAGELLKDFVLDHYGDN